MINWIIFFFRAMALTFDLLFDLNSMLMINLPLVAISRVIFIVFFYLNYFKYRDEETKSKNSALFTSKEKLYFIIRNAILIVLGVLSIYIAIFICLYSLLCSTIHLKNISNRQNKHISEIIGIMLYYILPVLCIICFLFVDFIALIPIASALLLFYFWGEKNANLPLKERHNKRIISILPGWAYYTIVIILTAIPLIVFLGLFFGGIDFIIFWSQISTNTFNFALIFFLNLPIILIARAVYFYALRYKNKNSEPFISLEKNKKLSMASRNAILVVVSSVFIYVSIFFAVYSLIASASVFYEFKKKGENQRSYILLILSYVLIPVILVLSIVTYLNIGIYGTLYIQNNVAITQAVLIGISGALSIPLFLYHKKEFKNFSLKQVVQGIKSVKGVPRFFQIFMLAFLIIMMPLIIVGPTVWGKPIKETNMVKMSDGTELATDVYYSSLVGKKPAPVILVRTPYGKSDWADELYVTLYSPQGYHTVIQDFRACHDSEGDIDYKLFTKAFTDGNETIDWILNQDWCNGKIASAGASALCINQYYYAGIDDVYRGENGLRAQSLWFGCPSLLFDAIMEGAYHESSVETWIKSTKPDNWRYQLDFIFDMISAPEIGIKSWEYNVTTLDVAPNQFSNVNVRAIHVGGWYDHFLGGTIRGYIGYDDLGTARARDHQLLIIGPWIHAAVYGGQQGEIRYPPSANGLPLLLEWEQEVFDEALLGMPTNIWDDNRVAYYLMGDPEDLEANYWKYAKDWPLNYSWNKWYFGKDTSGNDVLVDNGSQLVGNRNYSYLYDPRNPVITRGGNNQPFDTVGPMDQRPVEVENGSLRDDVLLFQSEVLENPYTIEGDLQANLIINSNCTDTDFVVKLCDIYPDGRRMLIIDSALTARYRENLTTENFLMSNQTYNLTVNLIASAYRFDAGHRIGVTITSSNYDRYAINPNTGGDLTDHFTESFIANNTIITGPGQSCILFPELI
ncbi:MAG: CocE/NonD family hydrolase [Candidatus Lokiarchaeota archaeon]|nr:CocE/NonD family hydrolase [Candidatus Lokiarchaeota archaeon]